MADRLLTLLEISKRNGADEAVGLIEETNTVAPEVEVLTGRPINGITYTGKKRKTLPATPIFRNANEGVDISSSLYEQFIAQCYYLDCQLQIDEAVLKAGKGEGNSAASILMDEAAGVVQQKMIALGAQFYTGTTSNAPTADAKGFTGLAGLYDTTNCEVTASGSTNTCSAWLVWNDLKGVHWMFGNNTGLELGEWTRQQVKDANSKSFTAMVNNLSGYIGLSFGHSRCAVRIKAIKNATNNWLTDALVAEALSKMPIFMRRSPGLKLFANTTACLTLQKSRSTTVGSKTDALPLQFAPQPTESNNVPIVLTDSLPQTEA